MVLVFHFRHRYNASGFSGLIYMADMNRGNKAAPYYTKICSTPSIFSIFSSGDFTYGLAGYNQELLSAYSNSSNPPPH